MKRLFNILTAFAAAACMAGCAGAVGDLCADSETVILDGEPIQSYTIDGRRVLCVEDLESYGFIISSDEDEINAVGDMSMSDEDTRETVSPGTGVTVKASKSKKTVKINSVSIDAYEADGLHYVAVDKLCEFRTEYNSEWGYSDYNMRKRSENGEIIIDLFRIGIPDTDTIFPYLEAMVDKPEIDVYTEDYSREAPYYGARLEPPSGIYAGINGDGVIDELNTPCYLNYIEFNDFQKDILRPNKDYVKDSSCICVIAWNVDDLGVVFDNEEYIRETLDNLAKYHKPMIIRFGAEMNVSQIGDAPSAFVNAFRMVADIVHEYPDFATMWSPNDMCALNKPFEYYYPGDEYVDWVGISAFMKKHFMSDTTMPRDGNVYFMTGDFAYHTNTVKNILAFMEENNIEKPVAISEGGTVTGLNYADGGETEEWSRERLGYMYWYLPMRYPQVKLINYFNHDTPDEAQTFVLDKKPEFIEIIGEALSNGQYKETANALPDFTFKKIGGEYNSASIPLYTYAYLPEDNLQCVDYIIDRELLCSCTEIPYFLSLNTAAISEGEHTLTVKAKGSESEVSAEYRLSEKSGKISISDN